jgi:predicted glycogen debranching enzyme
VLRLGTEVLRDPTRAAAFEWLLADGLGGYASSTVLGLNARRYHGLLVAALQAPRARLALLSRLDETLVAGGLRYELATNAYPGVVHPRGFEHAASFSLDPLPTLSWEVSGGRLSKTVARVHGEPGLVVSYAWDGEIPVRLELRPLLAYREEHALQRENQALRPEAHRAGDDVIVWPYPALPPLAMRVPGAEFSGDGIWYRQFEYARERERGLDFQEDLWSPGSFSTTLAPRRSAAFLAWVAAVPAACDAAAILAAERRRLRERGSDVDGALGVLRRAADAFVVSHGSTGRRIVAGYHGVEERGRDAMIALPGLCLATGRHREARSVLAEFAGQVVVGLVPGRSPGDGRPPELESSDASLWMAVATHRYLDATRDAEFARDVLRPALAAAIEGLRAGARHDMRITPDGLVTQGASGPQLTGRDARPGWRVPAPRGGCAVEVQALWLNALLVGAELARLAGEGERAAEWTALAGRTRQSALRAFWSEDAGYLADVVDGGPPDLSLRPNQLFAIGLPHALLPREKALRVLAAVRRELLTPVGLRTLAPSDPAYRGRCEAVAGSHDAAYHQGTAWPCLMGVYFDAAIRLLGEDGKREAIEWLRGFSFHLEEAGLGFVSQAFDGDAPHTPCGAIAQACSVAELLRVAERLPARSLSRALRIPREERLTGAKPRG